jgi:hypothetical protein
LGAEIDLDAGAVRWLSPLPLWTGILAGPIAWAFDLTASYALAKWACIQQSHAALNAIAFVSFAIVCVGAAVSWLALQHTDASLSTDGGRPRERARFMAILGLAVSALFALQIAAGVIPQWVLDACS